ncbi:MAG: insulinase family protein [Acidobacteriota bacterium]|nr:insulinase family protein [Acidobacteriota bacterium]
MKNRTSNSNCGNVFPSRVREFGRTYRFAFTLCLLLLALPTAGNLTPLLAAQRSAPAKAAAVQAQKADSIEDIVSKQAALVSEFEVNGLKVLVKRRESSLTVGAGLFIQGGTRNITANNAGIEALMLTTATEASANFPRERMRSELSRMGTVLGSTVNYDYSALTLIATRPNFDRSWEMFIDAALHPSFTKDDVTLIQSRMVASLRDDTDDPDTYLQRLQEKAAYAGHPYSNRAEGTAESVARLTPEDLQSYHQKLMETSRLLLVIVGDLDPMQVKAKVTASFAKVPRGTYKIAATPQLSFDKSTVEVTTRELPTNYVQGLFVAPPLTSPDIYPMRVAAALLRDRVFEEVRVKRNLSYAPSAFLGSQGANVGGIYVSAVDANKAISIMLDEIARLQRELISQEDIKGVVAQYLTTYYMSQETNAAQAAELAQAELIGGGWRNSTEFINRLRSLSPADVQRVAQKYMHNIRFVVIGDPKAVDTKVFVRAE